MAITGRSFPSHSTASRNMAATIVGAARGTHVSTGIVSGRRTNMMALTRTFVRNPFAPVIITSPKASGIHFVSLVSNRRRQPGTLVLDSRTALAEIARAKASGIIVESQAVNRRRYDRPRGSITVRRNMLAELARPKASGIHVFGVAHLRRQPPVTRVLNWRPQAIIVTPPISPLALQFIYFP